MQRSAALVLLCCALVAGGCVPASIPTPATEAPFGQATATPTCPPRPTVTPFPTPTLTPTPGPLTATLEVEPPQVTVGKTLLVRVKTSLQAGGSLFFEGESVPLFPGPAPNENVTFIGISIWAEPGPRQIVAVLIDSLDRPAVVSATVQVVAGDYPIDYVTLLPGRGALLDPQVNQEEWQVLEPLLKEVSSERLWAGSFISPTVGHISSYFGAMRSYNGGPPSSYHNGLDISNITGTLVVAPARGRVVLARPLVVRGQAILLDHGWGVHSGYFHLSEILVQEGELVEQGQPIGRVGATGLVSGAHLHWEMRVGLVAVDPLEWKERPFP